MMEKNIYEATQFAAWLQKEGEPPGLANYRAGQKYGYTASEVAYARLGLKEQYKIERGVYNSKKPSGEFLCLGISVVLEGKFGPYHKIFILVEGRRKTIFQSANKLKRLGIGTGDKDFVVILENGKIVDYKYKEEKKRTLTLADVENDF